MIDSIDYSTYINASPEEVYHYFASSEGMDAWFTDGAEIEGVAGGKMYFRWVNFGARRESAEDFGEVLQAEVGKKFVFTWQPGKTRTTVSISFTALGAGCRVDLTESGYSDSADDQKMMVYCACGWGEALTLLKFYLEYQVTYGEVPTV